MGKSKLKQQLKRKLPAATAPPSASAPSKKQLKKQRREAAAAAAASAQDADTNEHDDGELREIEELEFDDALAAGLAFEQMESFDGALAAFRAAVKTRPDSLAALSHLADVYAAAEQPQKALETYTAATALPDADASIWFRRGLTLMTLDQHSAAIKSLDVAKRLSLETLDNRSDPSDDANEELMKAYSVTLAALANCFGELGDIDGAVREYETAAVRFPAVGNMHYNLATMLLAKGEVARAAASLSRAVECSPETVEFYEELIECLQRSGDTDARVPALQQTLDALVAANAKPKDQAEQGETHGTSASESSDDASEESNEEDSDEDSEST